MFIRQYYLEHPEKVCPRCKVLKTNKDYTFSSKGKRASRCKDCYLVLNRITSSKNVAKRVDYNRQWILRNPEKKKAQVIKWRTENRDKVRHNNKARKTLLRSHRVSGKHYTSKEWEILKLFYAYTCLRCFRKEPTIILTADHVLPLSKGGSTDIGNIQPLCTSCNSKKHVTHIDYRVGAVHGDCQNKQVSA